MPASNFVPLALVNGPLLELRAGAYLTRVSGFADGPLALPEGETHYGMVVDGEIRLQRGEDRFRLRRGAFFVAPGSAEVDAGGGRGLVISCRDYLGLFQIGGPLEARGRLRYIDGCSDTLLVCPPRLGEPCLNHLHIPPRTDQSAHTHPSERIGVIAAGQGSCRTAHGVHPLLPGRAFCIPAGCVHSFQTAEHSLDVLAWHPDTDFGPTDGNHPMVNRTFLRPAQTAQ